MYMRLGGLIKRIYFNDAPLSLQDCEKSSRLFIFEGAAARTIFTLTSGAFLAGYAKYMGASDQFNGIIGAIPVLAGVIQVFSPMVFEKLESRKFLVSLLCFFHRLMLSTMVFIPLLFRDTALRLAAVTLVYFVSYLLVSFATPAASNWMVNLAPQGSRGSYFGMRESCILAFVTVVTLILGRVMDAFRQGGNEFGGFVVVFIVSFVLTAANFVLLSSIKEPVVKKSSISLDIKSIISIPTKDRKFRKVIVMSFLWNIGVQVGGPFFAVYMVTGLKLDYTYIMIMSLLGTLTNVIAVRVWGKVADKRSWVFTTKASIGVLAVTHLLWFFVNPATAAYFIPLLHIAGGAAWAGIGISIFNIQFALSPEDGKTVYLGFNAALGGLVGFLSTIIGSALLGVFAGLKFSLIGISIGNMQLIFAISGILLGGCTGYIHWFIKLKE